MSTARTPSLALLSLNVNGLGNSAKRLTLFHTLIQGAWDVILLQETHHRDEEQGFQWCREGAGEGRPWPGTSFWAHGTTASRGVAILVRDTVDIDSLSLFSLSISANYHEPEGRLLRIDLTWSDTPLSIICIYAPSTAEHRKDFFIHQLLPNIPQDRRLILGGDFNCVSDDLDVTPNALGSRRTGFSGGLEIVQMTFGLNDVFRELHPTQTRPSAIPLFGLYTLACNSLRAR